MKIHRFIFPGEDVNAGVARLSLDLVPSTTSDAGIPEFLPEVDQCRLGMIVFRRSQGACQACGQAVEYPPGKMVPTHPRWHFLDNGVQVLVRVMHLCPGCLAASTWAGEDASQVPDEVVDRFMRVNQWSRQQVLDHITHELSLCRERSNRDWGVDMSVVDIIREPPARGLPCIGVCSLENNRCLGCNRPAQTIFGGA